jgi:hypothetical protein
MLLAKNDGEIGWNRPGQQRRLMSVSTIPEPASPAYPSGLQCSIRMYRW